MSSSPSHDGGPVDPADLDPSVRPQDDFFRYASGGWIARNPVPPSEAVWMTFNVLHLENQERLHGIARDLGGADAEPGSPEQLVRDLWLAGMDEERVETLGFDPVRPLLERAAAIADRDDLQAFLAEAHRVGLNVAWALSVDPDRRDAERNVLYFHQAGLTLPDRDYYMDEGDEAEAVREALRGYAARLMGLAGWSGEDAEAAAETVLAFETRLARASMTRVERRDPHATYHPHELPDLANRAPAVDWPGYLTALGADTRRVIVSQPDFLQEVSAMVQDEPLEAWRTYLAWRALDGLAPLLHADAFEAWFDLHERTLQGTEEPRARWRRVVELIDATLGEALGRLYVERHFPPRAKAAIDELVANVVAACGERIRGLPWMGDATKERALEKLGAIHPKIGYPPKWEAYEDLEIDPRDLVGDVLRANEHEHQRDAAKVDQAVDPDDWEMTVPTVNAYFDPSRNVIVFPAGILQPPFFDPDRPAAMNYGAIGYVIGHEITHGFDDQGRKYDAHGNLEDWWTEEDAARFVERAEVLRRQYDAFEPLPGHHVNGELTLGENIADLGGLRIAYDAWELHREAPNAGRSDGDGRDPRELFFLGAAGVWRGSMREEEQKRRLVIDPHSPMQYRVNGPLSNLDAFHELFGTEPDDGMYRPPGERARIW